MINYCVLGFEILGSLVVVWGGVEAVLFFLCSLPKKNLDDRVEHIRCILGHKMLIGLDFFLAGDILATVNAPDWESIGILGALVAIRTILNYFLRAEIKQSKKDHSHLH